MRKILIVIFLLMITSSLLLSSCFLSNDDGNVLYKIKVDSLDIPITISQDDTLDIWLYGVVGGSSCYSFSHFVTYTKPSELKLTVWGKYPKKDVPCLCVMVYLEEKHSVYPPLNQGTFYIIIDQPDGSTLVDSVIVQ